MEPVISTPDSQHSPGIEKKEKGKFWKFFIGLVVLVVLGAVIFFVWSGYFSPEARQARNTQQNYEKYLAWEKAYGDAMREDTYGGKTPEETLRMFIDALKKGDIELASKYFMLDTSEKSPDYLTRRNIEEALRDKQKKGEIEGLVILVESAISNPGTSLYEGDFEFSIEENGEVISNINMGLNKYSNVWKIESL